MRRDTRRRLIEETTIFLEELEETDIPKIEEWLVSNSAFIHTDYMEGVKEFLIPLPHPTSKRASLAELIEDAPKEIKEILTQVYADRTRQLNKVKNSNEDDQLPDYDITQDFGFVLVELYQEG